jgi:hypothetical protein
VGKSLPDQAASSFGNFISCSHGSVNLTLDESSITVNFPGYEFPDIDLFQAELLQASSMALHHLYGKSQSTAIT